MITITIMTTTTITITATTTHTARSTAMAIEKTPGFLPLMVWLSPSFPVGAFAYSHGIEWAVEAGDIKSAAALETWLDDLLEHGGPWSDAVLLAAAHQAIEQGNDAALAKPPSLRRRFLRPGSAGSKP